MATSTGGLTYNGSEYSGIGSSSWAKGSGCYAIRPSINDNPQCDMGIKLGMAGGSSSRGLLARISNHATALVDFSIKMIVTVDGSAPRTVRASKVGGRQSRKTQRYQPLGLAPEEDLDRGKSMSRILEAEIFAFLRDEPSVTRKKHRSGVNSEVVIGLSEEVLKRLFEHLINPTSTPKGPSNWMPQLSSAYYFDEELEMAGQVEPPSKFSYIVNLDPTDEQRRRVLQQELKVARKKGQQDRIAELEEQLLKLADGAGLDEDLRESQPTETPDESTDATSTESHTQEYFDLPTDEADDLELQASSAILGAPIPVAIVNEILNRGPVTRSMVRNAGMALRSTRIIPNSVFEALSMF